MPKVERNTTTIFLLYLILYAATLQESAVNCRCFVYVGVGAWVVKCVGARVCVETRGETWVSIIKSYHPSCFPIQGLSLGPGGLTSLTQLTEPQR